MFVHDMEILIRVHPGRVYFMGGDGATGKSYLFSLLKARNQVVDENSNFLKAGYITEIQPLEWNIGGLPSLL